MSRGKTQEQIRVTVKRQGLAFAFKPEKIPFFLINWTVNPLGFREAFRLMIPAIYLGSTCYCDRKKLWNIGAGKMAFESSIKVLDLLNSTPPLLFRNLSNRKAERIVW